MINFDKFITDYRKIVPDPHFIDCALSNQGFCFNDNGELEKVNPIVSKFKVGDWIVHNNANFLFKIKSIGYTGYQVVDNCGFQHNVAHHKEDEYHLWSIQDAKNGDVLTDGSCIFILKNIHSTYISSGVYCYLLSDGDFFIDRIFSFCEECTKPASQEDRNLLFEKIKEAGYEWNPDKLELKPIKQIPSKTEEKTDNIPEYEDNYMEFKECLKDFYDDYQMKNSFGTETEKTIQQYSEKLLSIAREEILSEEIDLAYKTQDKVQYTNGYDKAIDDVCRWIEYNISKYGHYNNNTQQHYFNTFDLIENLKEIFKHKK